MPHRYLDYNATAPLRPEVRAALSEALASVGNASSVHAQGRDMRARLEQAREAVAVLAGTSAKSVLFTASASEANNHVAALAPALGLPLAVSAIEHPSMLVPATGGEADVEVLAVDGQGRVAPANLKDRPQLVCVMAANNETGVIQPLTQIKAAVQATGGKLHSDAVQALGKMAFSFDGLDLDYAAISAHKIGGPPGVGALLVKGGVEALPLSFIKGGGQERRRRAGTENWLGIIGFGAAAKALIKSGTGEAVRMARLRDEFETALKAVLPEVIIFSKNADRLPNTSCFALPGFTASFLLMALDLKGLSISAGSACSSGKVEASHVLQAMGLDDSLAMGALRVSFGWQSRPEDSAALLTALKDLVARANRQVV